MRRLYLLRHAKSSWDGPSPDDRDRPLAPRGARAAPRMGAYMSERGYRPEVVLCSPSRRTRETWSRVRGALGPPAREEFCEDIYLAPASTLLALVRGLDDRFPSALVVGHNPGTADLAAGLAAPSAAAGFGRYPTGALAVFDLDVQGWGGAGPGAGKVVEFVRPADLGARGR